MGKGKTIYTHAHTHTHARTHTRARTHARTHTHMHTQDARWAEKGTGPLSILLNKESGKSRVVMRTKEIGKLILNTLLYKGLSVSQPDS